MFTAVNTSCERRVSSHKPASLHRKRLILAVLKILGLFYRDSTPFVMLNIRSFDIGFTFDQKLAIRRDQYTQKLCYQYTNDTSPTSRGVNFVRQLPYKVGLPPISMSGEG